jgi:hypothetical protein
LGNGQAAAESEDDTQGNHQSRKDLFFHDSWHVGSFEH